MAPFVKGLKDDVIIALAEHYAKLAPEPSDEPVDPTLAARGKGLAVELRCASCHLSGLRGPRADAPPRPPAHRLPDPEP